MRNSIALRAPLLTGRALVVGLSAVLCSGLTPGDGQCEIQADKDESCVRTSTPPPTTDKDVVNRRNVLGGTLSACSFDPLTGWFRDGFCRTDERDRGLHVVCAQVDAAFLTFTKAKGNDLSRPLGSFPGLSPGDRWCLCASRWAEAARAGVAPPVVLEATQRKAMTIVPLLALKKASVYAAKMTPPKAR